MRDKRGSSGGGGENCAIMMRCSVAFVEKQVLAEGVLRKAMKKDRVLRWDLCLSAADSVARRANLAQSYSSGACVHVGELFSCCF